MTRNGAQIVWECLLREEAGTVFGIPGGAVLTLYHHLSDYPIRHVLMRHEQAAIHAADAFARVTGTMGVCMTTSGPGATNLVTGLATALCASSPVLVITGQAPSPLLGTDAFQEVDITSMTDAVTKHNYLITSLQDLEQAIVEGCHVARTGRPGPVLVAVTVDVQKSETEDTYLGRIAPPGYDPARHKVAPVADGCAEPRRPAGVQPGTGSIVPGAIVQQILDASEGTAWLVCDPVDGGPDRDACGPQAMLGPGPMETMGFALPAAIGVQVALPREQVWALASVDSVQATIQELATVVQEDLPIRVVILNRNSAAAGPPERTSATIRPNPLAPPLGPNFARLAAAYGIPALEVRDQAGVRPALEEAAACRGPVLIDFQLG